MKLEKLTKEQEALIPTIRQQWLDRLFTNRQRIDRAKATEGIEWLYAFSKLEKPTIIYVDSPIACQYAVHLLKKLFAEKKIFETAQVGAQVWDQVRAQVWDQVRAQVGDQVRDQVRAQVGDQVRDQVRAEKIEVQYFANYGSIWDFGWLAFYEYFRSIGIKVEHEGFDKFNDLMKCGIYDMIQLKGFCIVSELPTDIKRDASNQLHNTEGSAIKWSDNYEQYYIHGRAISKKYFDSISNKSFTMEDFISEENEESKSTCIAMMQDKYGDEYIVSFFREHLKEIDTYVDKKKEEFLEGTTNGMNVGVYTLFKGQINNENIAYVRCYCPSTDRMFFLGVDSTNKTAKDAIASLYRIPIKLKPFIKSISRQGERFSTILNEEGKELLSTLSEKDISEVSGLTGSAYFKLIQYEF
jgi:hypothetical protein